MSSQYTKIVEEYIDLYQTKLSDYWIEVYWQDCMVLFYKMNDLFKKSNTAGNLIENLPKHLRHLDVKWVPIIENIYRPILRDDRVYKNS